MERERERDGKKEGCARGGNATSECRLQGSFGSSATLHKLEIFLLIMFMKMESR